MQKPSLSAVQRSSGNKTRRRQSSAEHEPAPKRVKVESFDEMPLVSRPQPEACKAGGWQQRVAKANAKIESLEAERDNLIDEVNRLKSALELS